MSNLWAELGYDGVSEKAAAVLRDGGDICLIEGPPGVGKSWLARDIGSLWEGRGGATVLAEGDSLKGDAFFYPFGIAMGGLPSGWQAMGSGLAGMARAGETLIGTAGLITATIEAILKARGSVGTTRKPFLGDPQQDALHEIERLADERPLLFIADNFHWWDADSITFLGRLRDPRMWEAFPFLEDLRVLAVQTPEPYQSANNPETRDAFLGDAAETISLDRIPREGFEDVLVALGAASRPAQNVADVIYSFSGGHLALAGRCADRIRNGESEIFLNVADAEEFLRRLITDRIRSLGSTGREAVALLEVAAILGLAFRRKEISCASETEESATVRLLRYCRGEGLLETVEGMDRFVHEFYHRHFLDLGQQDKVTIHERLSLCLRKLRPAEYSPRCLNALDAEEFDQACTLAIHAALQKDREGRSWEELPPGVAELLRAPREAERLTRFLVAKEHLDQARFGDCLGELDRLPRELPKSLQAEASFLRAMCLMSTRSEEDRADGRSILRAWLGYEDEEFEIGIRLLQLHLYGLSKLTDKEEGRQLEVRVRQVLGERAAYEETAKDALYVLDRCSSGLYPPEVALVRKGEAVAHFEPKEGQTVVRNPIEYYRCLNNYCAGLLSNARYEEALAACIQLEELIAEYSPGTFPRLDFPYMNSLLARYRLDQVDADAAVERQREIVEGPHVVDDPFYGMNALGVFLSLAEEFNAALDVFDSQASELTQRRINPEASMLYLISANRCVTWFLSGKTEEAVAEWDRLADLVSQITYMFRPLLIRRHQLLGEVMATTEGTAMSPREFDECLIAEGTSEFGRHWRSFGRGFRLPEVEFWREI